MGDGTPFGRTVALPGEFEPTPERDAAGASRELRAVTRGGAPVAARTGAEEVEIPAPRCGLSRRRWTTWRTGTKSD